MKKGLNNTPNPHQSLSLFRLKIVGFHPIRQGGFVWSSAPRAIVRCRPRFRPRTAVANDIIPGQIVFIQFCLFAGTAGARRGDDHFVLAPVYPCPPPRPPRTTPTVVEPPTVLFKYLDDAGTFSPIFAQHSRCRFCIVIDYRLDFAREFHDILIVVIHLQS